MGCTRLGPLGSASGGFVRSSLDMFVASLPGGGSVAAGHPLFAAGLFGGGITNVP